jgi:hypothetical protein
MDMNMKQAFLDDEIKWIRIRIYLVTIFLIAGLLINLIRATYLQIGLPWKIGHLFIKENSINEEAIKKLGLAYSLDASGIEKIIARKQENLKLLQKGEAQELKKINELNLLLTTKSNEIDKLNENHQKLKKLNQSDVDALKLILQDSINTKSSSGLIYSFIVGIISSLVASWLFAKRKYFYSEIKQIYKLLIDNYRELLRRFFIIRW